MNKSERAFFGIFLRYTLLVLSALPGLTIFYIIFTPLTIYGTYFLFNLFFPASLFVNSIFLNDNIVISIIPACVAGAAYYLLFILNLSVPDLKSSKRIYYILLVFLSFLLLNILRIFLLGVFYFYNVPFFDLLHKFLWYFGSSILIACLWFAEIYFFKIKGVPFYSDIKFIYKKSLFNKR